MIVLYDNPFSPFARKVRMALGFKEVPYESIDALALVEHARLHTVNRRAEVPVLVDGDVTVVDSADIVAYLEDRFPTPSLLPPSPADRATARRWQRVAQEATKQCGRAHVPSVQTPQPLSAWLGGDDASDLRVCLWEDGGTPLRRVVDDLARRPRRVSVVVGPEGGLTAEEVSLAGSAGYTVVTLGHRILRTETAAVTAVALLQYTLGDLGGDTS